MRTESDTMSRHRGASGPSRSGVSSPIVWAIASIVFSILIVAALGLGGLSNVSDAPIGSRVDFSLNDFSNQPVRVSDYRGHPILVNLWASWCPPCRAEMPDLIQFYRDHRADGLVFLAVNSEDDANAARPFIQEQAMPFPVLYDPEGTVQRLFHSKGLPSTFFIDKSGRLRFSWTGQISPRVLGDRVLPLLSQ